MASRRSSKSCWIVATVGVLTTATNAGAQTVVLEVKQGQSWTDKILIPEIQTMSFRWKWNGRGAPSSASWQMTFTSPAATSNPAPMAGVGALVPMPRGGRLGEYAHFQVPPNAIPSSVPRTFYIRLRSGGEYSSWIPISISSRAASRATRPVSPEPKRASPTAREEAAASPGGFTIPGGGKPAQIFDKYPDPHMPITVKLTGIECIATATVVYSIFAPNSVSVSATPRLKLDNVYAVIAAIDVNKKSPATSPSYVRITEIFPLAAGIKGNMDIPAWGPPDGTAVGIPAGKFAVVAVVLMHRFGGPNLALAKLMIEAEVKQGLSKLAAPTTIDNTLKAVRTIAHSSIAKTLEPGDRRVTTKMEENFLEIGDNDLQLVRDGKVLQRPMTVSSEAGGTFKIGVTLRK